jgi:site-specific recombinase XerC
MASRDSDFELFYSSGLRLAELVRLEVGDLDSISATVRVFGKGAKERICPVGIPPWRRFRAIEGWPAFTRAPISTSRAQAFGAIHLGGNEEIPWRIRSPGGFEPAQDPA